MFNDLMIESSDEPPPKKNQVDTITKYVLAVFEPCELLAPKEFVFPAHLEDPELLHILEVNNIRPCTGNGSRK